MLKNEHNTIDIFDLVLVSVSPSNIQLTVDKLDNRLNQQIR